MTPPRSRGLDANRQAMAITAASVGSESACAHGLAPWALPGSYGTSFQSPCLGDVSAAARMPIVILVEAGDDPHAVRRRCFEWVRPYRIDAQSCVTTVSVMWLKSQNERGSVTD